MTATRSWKPFARVCLTVRLSASATGLGTAGEYGRCTAPGRRNAPPGGPPPHPPPLLRLDPPRRLARAHGVRAAPAAHVRALADTRRSDSHARRHDHHAPCREHLEVHAEPPPRRARAAHPVDRPRVPHGRGQ